MYQKLLLIGHLGKDPEMRYTPQGQAVTNFSLATTDKWHGQDGQAHERTTWWRVSVWGKIAEACNEYLKKGSQVLVEGKVIADDKGNPKTFARQDGTTGAAFEVNALTVKFLSNRANDNGTASNGVVSNGGGQAPASPLDDNTDDIPF